ncbi:MAG: ferritin [Phycisphaerae bacterium]|nr:ferritin [Phycisphaerae bacterium]
MISKKMQDALNEQINAELYSAYLYLSMVAYFKSINLPGFATWMRVQTQEEIVHAMKIYDYLNERGGRVILKSIDEPQTEWKSPLAAFEAAYGHEQKVTGLINGLVNLAIEEKDHAANMFLQWFVNEQVEEESNADAIVQKLKLMAEAPGGMYMLDNEMGQRVFTPPAAGGGQ